MPTAKTVNPGLQLHWSRPLQTDRDEYRSPLPVQPLRKRMYPKFSTVPLQDSSTKEIVAQVAAILPMSGRANNLRSLAHAPPQIRLEA